MGNHINLLQSFYATMTLIRCFEKRISVLYEQGELCGTTHFCTGQEAVAVGVVSAIGAEDIVVSNHRGHGHYIAYTGECDSLMAELMGRKSGTCRGWGGSQHLCNRNFYSNGVQGGMVPVATGMALCEARKKSGIATTLFIGDGTLGQGIVYEALNMAALWSAPLLIVVENNQYAMSTPIKQAVSGSIAGRAEAFNIPTTVCDGNDVYAVYEVAKKILDGIRTRPRPHMLVLSTYRFCGHSKSDDGAYRPAGEVERWLKKDPLEKIRSILPGSVADTLDEKAEVLVEHAELKARENDYDKMQWSRQ